MPRQHAVRQVGPGVEEVEAGEEGVAVVEHSRIRNGHNFLRTEMNLRSVCVILGLVSALVLGGCGTSQKSFDTPEAAVAALDEAVRAQDDARLRAVLGPRVSELKSGDPVQDRADFVAFASRMAQSTRVESVDGKSVLLVGDEQWEFPAPIIRTQSGWQFDTDAGIEELTTRRIGANELAIIDACFAFIDAEIAYGTVSRDGSGTNQYTAKMWSTPGSKDGLYWETQSDEPDSPIGPAMAAAEWNSGRDCYPFYGYFFRPLLKQGPSAVGGAMDYVEDGKLVKGVAGVAFPAEYGTSGIMTFIFSMDGRVYQKDLGPQTSSIARSMDTFDPGEGWTSVAEVMAVEGGE